MTGRADPYPSRHGGEARMIDRRDPVIFTDHGESAPLDLAQNKAYERDGFLRLDGLFSEREIRVLIEERDRLRAIAADDPSITVIAEPDSRIVRSIFKVHTVSDVFNRLARDARLVNLARYLLGDGVYIHQSRLNYKPGFFGREFYWHSDFETWHVEDGMPRMRALSVSISLTSNTPNNGPLMLIPGSHKRYVVCTGETPEDHFRQSLRKQEYGVPDPESLRNLVSDGGIETITGPAGTVAIFDCNTMHGSNGNITPDPRSNVFIVYNSVGNRVGAPYGPDRARPDFLAERNTFEPLRSLEGQIEAATGT